VNSCGFNGIKFILEIGEEIFIGRFVVKGNEEIPGIGQTGKAAMDGRDKF